MHIEVHVSLHVKCQLLLSDYNQNWNVMKRILLKRPNINPQENLFNSSRVVIYG
jgi:hypothetical protein